MKGEINLNHIISIVLFVLLGIFIIIDYFKDKKVYRLLAIIPILFAIFFRHHYQIILVKHYPMY